MQTNDFSNLPNSWQIKTLGEVLNYEQPTKYIVKSTKYNDSYKTPVLTAGKSFILGYTDELEGIFTQIPVIIFDDFTTDTKFVDFKFKVKSSAMKILHSKENADIKFIYYFMQTIRHRSDTHKRYWISEYAKIKIPLPPLEIQKRIVARLESAFEKIEKGSAHLQNAKTKLAKYKQSLLKSAFDGTLTATASLQGVEKAEAIHKVDCHDLTSSNLAMTDKENPKLPQGWTIKTLGEVLSNDKYAIKRGPFGSSLKKNFFVKSGVRVFEQYNPINQDVEWKRYFITQEKFKELEAFKAGAGDLLVSCSGTLGKILELPQNVEVGIINQALLKIRLDNTQILNSYFVHLFNSPYMQKIILENTLGSTIQNIASVKELKQIKIPLPPLETQKQIVKLLEKHLQHADKTGEFIESALNKAKQLKQSLLKSAFLGKLT